MNSELFVDNIRQLFWRVNIEVFSGFFIDDFTELFEALADFSLKIFTYPEDLELSDLFAYELPLALKELYVNESNQNQFDWNQPGHAFLRHFLRKDILLPALNALAILEPDDLIVLTELGAENLTELGPPHTQARIIKLFLESMVSYGFSLTDENTTISQKLDHIAIFVSQVDDLDELWKRASNLLDGLFTIGENFSNQKTTNFSDSLEGLIWFALYNGRDAVSTLQKTSENHLHPEFFRDLILDINGPFTKPDDPTSLYNMILDVITPDGSDFLKDFIRDEKSVETLSVTLKALSNNSYMDWIELLEWLSDIDDETVDSFEWLSTNLKWRPDSSPSYPLFTERVTKTINPAQDILQNQIDLLIHWIKETSYWEADQ